MDYNENQQLYWQQIDVQRNVILTMGCGKNLQYLCQFSAFSRKVKTKSFKFCLQALKQANSLRIIVLCNKIIRNGFNELVCLLSTVSKNPDQYRILPVNVIAFRFLPILQLIGQI